MSVKLFVMLALLGGETSGVVSPTPSIERTVDANNPVQSLLQECVTGTLIFSQGDCLAVKIYTQSSYTHVGVIVRRNDAVIVYDSTSGKGVRCQTLENYLDSQDPSEIYVFHPREPLTKNQTQRLERYLDSQLGRPYDIAHHVTGRRADGVHCAEYATDALMACNLMRAEQPSRVSPASLAVGVVESKVYHEGHQIVLKEETVEVEHAEELSWCSRMWLDTKNCTSNFCRSMKRKVFCR